MSYKNVRDAMSKLQLDAVVVSSPENTEYFAGFSVRTQMSIRDRLVIGVVKADATRTLIICDIEESLARTRVPYDDVRSYVEFVTRPIHLLRDVLVEAGLERARIGIETKHLTQDDYEGLAEAMPDTTMVPVDDALEAVRSIKSSDEIVELRNALARTEAAVIDAWSSGALGMTEQALDSAMRGAFIRSGADGTRHCTVAFGANTVHAHHTSSSTTLREGDLVRSDFGAVFGRFGTDIARMGVGGKPSIELERFYAKTYDVHMQLSQMLRPGVVAGDIYRRAQDLFASAQVRFDLPHIGHSLRIDGGHENPILHPNNAQTLEENMLIALEPIARTDNGELCGTEDVFLVTSSDPEPLTGTSNPAKLFQIGA